jgi:hypothetical protein
MMLAGGTIVGLMYFKFVVMPSDQKWFHLALVCVASVAAMQLYQFY